MTNILEKTKLTDVHMHIDKAYRIIDGNLPRDYTDAVLQKLPEDKTLTSGIIRNIKKRITKYPQSRIAVINALVEVANEYQQTLKNLEELTK